MRVVGVDLAGKVDNDSGFCVLIIEDGEVKTCETKLIKKDSEIIEEVKKIRPDCIAIDAPFWIPREGIQVRPWRKSDILLMKRGFRPYSLALPTVQQLAMRASYIVKQLRNDDHKVIEVFSKASERILGLSKAHKQNKDKYDALVCALTARAYLENNYEDLEGVIIPK